MSTKLLPIADIPAGLREAAARTTLVPFIGAGASLLAGCPGWKDFADKSLRWLVGQGKFSYSQLDQISHLHLIADVLSATIEAHVPEYDYEDRLRKLLNTLASNGKKNEVLRMLDRLLSLPGMHDLFNELTRSVTRANNELLSG